jgi:dienelactone hydrolase
MSILEGRCRCRNRTDPETKLFSTTPHTDLGPRCSILRSNCAPQDTPFTLYNGEVFIDRNDAVRKIQELGFDRLLERAIAAVEKLPHGVVYAGFSNGGVCAELLAATRAGAQGAILMHAPFMVRDLGWKAWPANVPVQVHFAAGDPIKNQAVIDGGSTFEQFEYDAPGHLFADPAFPAYDANAARLMTARVLDFLDRLAT